MAPGRKNRSAAALEPVVDTAVAVPMDIPDAMHVDVAKKVRSRKMTEPVEAEKENLVNTVVPPKRGAGKASNKARAPAEAPQPPSQPEAVEEEAQLPVAEKSQDAKPSRRAPRKKVLQDCTPVTETEVNAVAKNLQDIQLGRPQQQKGRKASSKVAEVPEVAAAEPMEEPEATEEAPKIKGALQKQQKVEKDEARPRRRAKDPEQPKRGTTAYIAFAASRRPALNDVEPKLSFTEIAKVLGEEWRKLSDEEKAPFEKIASDDKLRYAEEKEAYLKRAADSPNTEINVKRKVKVQLKDPSKPKKAPSGYDIFRREMQQKIKEEHPEASFSETNTILAGLWRDVSEAGKQEYKQKALPAQEKYKEEISQYRAKQT